MDGRLQVFSGTSHPELAQEIMADLEAPLGRAIVGTWKNGETRVKLEENVRGCDVFAIQSMSQPVNNHLVELLLVVDALRRASAARPPNDRPSDLVLWRPARNRGSRADLFLTGHSPEWHIRLRI